MNEILTVTTKVDGKYPYITAGKYRYGVKSLTGFEIGKTYSVEYNLRPVTMKDGKTFDARDIVSFKEYQLPNGHNTTGNGALTDKDKAIEAMSHSRNETMSRCNALSNACLMVDAVAKVLASTTTTDAWGLDEIESHLKKLKDAEYLDNLRRLGIKPDASDTF